MQAHLFLDLRPGAMHEHNLDAHCLQERDIGNQRIEQTFMHNFAAEADDESLIAERVDVRRDRAHPVDELRVVSGRLRDDGGPAVDGLLWRVRLGNEVGLSIHAGIIMRPHVERTQ
jgi:hypothetical protein